MTRNVRNSWPVVRQQSIQFCYQTFRKFHLKAFANFDTTLTTQ